MIKIEYSSLHSIPTNVRIMHLLLIICNSTSSKRQQRQTSKQ